MYKYNGLFSRAIFLTILISVIGNNNLLLSADDSDREPVELVLVDIPTKEARTLTAKISRELFETFLKKYPYIKVKGFQGVRLEDQLSMDSVVMSMAGGTAPDVVYSPFRNLSRFVEQGFFYPLDDYYKEWRKEEDLDKKILPQIWKVLMYKGHLWTVPQGYGIRALTYRKDLFKKAGLDPDKPPKNWDELYEYAKKLTDQEKGKYGFGFMGRIGNLGWDWQNLLWQAGGEVLEEDKQGNWRAVFNSKAGVEALKFYQKLVRGKWERNGKEYSGVAKIVLWTIWDEFEEGKIAMAIGGGTDGISILPSEWINTTDPYVIGVAPLPRGPKGAGGSELNSTMLGINGTIKDKRKRDAAWEYIKFMASDEAIKIKISRLVEGGYAKFINPNYLKKFGYEEYLSEVPKGWIEMYNEMILYAHPEPYGKNCEFANMGPPIDKVVLYDRVDYKRELDLAAQKANEKIVGYPKEIMNKRRRIVTFVLIGLFIIIGYFFFVYIRGMFKGLKTQAVVTELKPGDRRKILFGWALMLPALLTILVWNYIPLIRGLFMAFQDYRIIGVSKWVGIDNFVSVIYEDTFWVAVKNTIIYVSLTLLLGFTGPIILALLLNEIPKRTVIYRVVYYLPSVTSPLVVLLLWKRFYDPSAEGLFNQILHFFGVSKQLWLQDPNLAMACIIIIGVWSGIGAGSIFYLAALKMIPEELYEAADLDGAGIWRKIWYVTLPILKPLLVITFVGAFVGSFHATERILATTGGGPLQATHVLGLEIFFNAFTYLKFGYATAVAWIMGGLLIGFTVQQLKILRESRFKAGI